MMDDTDLPADDPYAAQREGTERHRKAHGCGAFPFGSGPLLTELVTETGATKLLELGTAIGYTACCLLAGNPKAMLDTVDGDAGHVRLARQALSQQKLGGRARVHHGQFIDMLAKLRGPFDLVFYDGFAPETDVVIGLHDVIRPGGLLICANLNLMGRREYRRLRDEFDDTDRWQPHSLVDEDKAIIMIRV